MNGQIRLPLRGTKHYTVYGGPYRDIPNDMLGVKMAKEIDLDCEVDIPTRDFHTPDRKQLTEGLRSAVRLILSGQPVYVGCMGGIGRTGLFLAILAKAFRVKSPVPYIRRKYHGHAVETKEQYEYVTKYRIPADVRRAIRKAKIKSYFNPFHLFTDQLTNWNGDDSPRFSPTGKLRPSQPVNGAQSIEGVNVMSVAGLDKFEVSE